MSAHAHGFRVTLVIGQESATQLSLAANMTGCDCYDAATRERIAQAIKDDGTVFMKAIGHAAGLQPDGPSVVAYDSGDRPSRAGRA